MSSILRKNEFHIAENVRCAYLLFFIHLLIQITRQNLQFWNTKSSLLSSRKPLKEEKLLFSDGGLQIDIVGWIGKEGWLNACGLMRLLVVRCEKVYLILQPQHEPSEEGEWVVDYWARFGATDTRASSAVFQNPSYTIPLDSLNGHSKRFAPVDDALWLYKYSWIYNCIGKNFQPHLLSLLLY